MKTPIEPLAKVLDAMNDDLVLDVLGRDWSTMSARERVAYGLQPAPRARPVADAQLLATIRHDIVVTLNRCEARAQRLEGRLTVKTPAAR